MNVLIINGFGINCENETAFAFEQAGTTTKILHISELIKNPNLLDGFSCIVLPGGFSYGDNLGAGFALASLIRITLLEKIQLLISQGVRFLGICNGCQVLVKLGLFDDENFKITITDNADNMGYKCTWRECTVNKKFSLFGDIETINLPVAHGEGRFVWIKNNKIFESSDVFEGSIGQNCDIFLQYKSDYNGSTKNTAGVINKTKNVIALMPHPERAIISSGYGYAPSFLRETYISFFKNFLLQ